MLISKEEVRIILQRLGIAVKGVLHIGAHECEELDVYRYFGVDPTDVVWIDALEEKVAKCKAKGVPNVYQAVITEKDNEEVTFHITNNFESSSVLEFGSHARHHPWVVETEKRALMTIRLDTFFRRHNLSPEKYTFWNLDIQGVELQALKSGQEFLKHVTAIYSEVNTEEVYKGCGLLSEMDAFLATHGFSRLQTKMTDCGWGDALWVKLA
jgi:FkbM family methyltransferase